MEDDTKTDRQNLKYSGSYAPSQTFVAAALLFFPEPLQLLNFCTYSKQKARTNTIVANTKYTIQWQIHKSKQSLNDPLAFCEQRPAGESICLKPAGDEYSTRPKFYIAVQILQIFNMPDLLTSTYIQCAICFNKF